MFWAGNGDGLQPRPELCDGPQALRLEGLDERVADVTIVRRAYEQRRARVA